MLLLSPSRSLELSRTLAGTGVKNLQDVVAALCWLCSEDVAIDAVTQWRWKIKESERFVVERDLNLGFSTARFWFCGAHPLRFVAPQLWAGSLRCSKRHHTGMHARNTTKLIVEVLRPW